MEDGIRNLEIEKNTNGELTSIKVVFGPHYFLEVNEVNGHLKFLLGVTHHGFEADASEVGKGLEEIIWHIKEKFPETSFD
jgi:hypothetical protein